MNISHLWICWRQHYFQHFTMGGGSSWRIIPQTNEENLDFVRNYQPERNTTNHLRILLHGPVGAGKSSFINSVNGVLKGEVTTHALTDATHGPSFTKQYKTHKIFKGPETFYPFVFNDIMGIEQQSNHGVHVEDIKLALKGHVRDGYKFKPGQPIETGDSHFNPSPSLDDKVHVLLFVIPADMLDRIAEEVWKKMREVRLAASELGIPQLAILTKIDKTSARVQRDISSAHRDQRLKNKVDLLSLTLGPPPNCIFVVKNYESEIQLNDDVSALILCALRHMINHGGHYLNHM